MNDKKNFIWNFLGLSINSFNSLFFLIIINRINGGVDAGVFTYAFSLIGLIFYIGLFYTRAFQISNNKITNKEYIVHRSINCTLMVITTLVLCVIFNYDFYKSSIIILIGLYRMLEAFADVFYGILQSKDELYKAGRSMFFKGIIGILLFGIVDYITKDVRLACMSLVIVNLLGVIFYDILNSKKYITNEFKKESLKLIYRLSYPIFIYSFLNIYLVNATKYTLDFYDSAEIQNIFGIILMPGTVLSLCCQYILNPYLLKFNNYKDKKDYKSFNQLLFRIVFVIFGLGILAEVCAFLIGIPLLNFIYNIELSEYKLMLLVILIGATAYAIVGIFTALLTVLGKNTMQMFIYVISSIFAFIVSLVLVQSFNILGASIGYTLIMLLLLILYVIYYKYTLNKLDKE